MTLPEIGPLSLSEILDRMFTVYRRNFLLLVLTYGLPIILVIPFLAVLFAGMFAGASGQPSEARIGSALSAVFLVVVFFGIASVLAWLATTSAVWEIQLGRKPTIRSSYAKAWSRLGVSLVSGFLGMFAFFAGYMLLVIPGILVGLALSLTVPILTVERLGPVASLERSWSLTKGYRWSIFVTGLICYFTTVAMAYGVVIPAMIVLPNMLTPGGTIHTWVLILIGVAYALALILPAPLLAIALCLIYYDARVRKEGFDLQVMIDSLAPVPSPSPQAPLAG